MDWNGLEWIGLDLGWIGFENGCFDFFSGWIDTLCHHTISMICTNIFSSLYFILPCRAYYTVHFEPRLSFLLYM
jgi:hypothetical protein